jgi:predicted patatin/cPLA2 family phospholipase
MRTNDLQIHQRVLSGFRNYSPYVLWLVGILVIFANLWAYSKLAPLEQNIQVMAKQLNVMEQQVSNIENQHDSFVQKDTFIGLVERLNHISQRVDSIYSIVATKDK